MYAANAALLRDAGGPLSVEAIVFEPPREHEAVVRIEWAGICGSDLHQLNRPPGHSPMILGHEGAGVIEAIGNDVRTLQVGDSVIFSFIPSCGRCPECTRGATVACVRGPSPTGTHIDGTFRARTLDGEPVGQMQRLGAFSERVVVHEDSCVWVEPATNLRLASILSCGFTTGFGAAVNAAGTQIGDSVAVIGVGGVGMAAVQGAALAGAATLIAVDVNDAKLELSRGFGATHTVNATHGDWVQAVRDLTEERGADRAILCVGAATSDQIVGLVDCVGVGGVAVIVGAAHGVDRIDVDPRALMWSSKSIVGSLYGGLNPQREQRRLLRLHVAGRIKLEAMVNAEYTLETINDGLADLAAGRNLRGVVKLGSSPVST